MGNSASAERADFLQRDARRFSQLVQERNGGDGTSARGEAPTQINSRDAEPGLRPADAPSRRDSNAYGTFRSQVSAQSVTMQTGGGRPSQTLGTDEVVYEQEERPLVNMEELGLRDAPITHIAASPLNRRRSTMSRLGSRILPNAVVRGLHNSGEETPAEGRAHRNGIAARLSRSNFERRPRDQSGHRFSMFGSFSSRNTPSTISRRQSIRGPFPANFADAELLQDAPETTYLNQAFPASQPAESLDTSRGYSWQRRARLNRVRNSLTTPLSSIFGQSPEPSAQLPRTPPRRPSRVAFAEDSDHLLPPLSNLADTRLDFDEPAELDSVEPELRHPLPSPTASTRALNAANGIRRLPHALRSRSTRLIRRGEPTSLSTILHVAAAAIAAQLSGNPSPPVPAGSGLGGEGLDSLHALLQTLQNATTPQANGNDGPGPAAGDPPVNILRVFRFVNGENRSGASGTASPAPTSGPTSSGDAMDLDEPPSRDNIQDGRTVTLVVVGVRSVPSDGALEDELMGPSLDTLLSLPLLPSASTRPTGPRELLRRADVRSRWSSRRNSMGSFSSFPSQYESQRHHRGHSSLRSQSESVPLNASGSTLPTVLSESPPGPHPPPSTPAEPGMSGTTTPNRRPSSASAIHPSPLPHLLENPLPRSDLDLDENEAPYNPATQRRRSDSEFARRPELSSGAARRNGVVEPDGPPAQGGRSWLIYVVGTNVSENHPAFATPSLFTDNPTYEDMLLISSLLGPAKPPVASEAEVNSAGGVYRIVEAGGSLIAEPLGDADPIDITSEDRCLICLSDYDPDEELRLLNKCNHMFHRECIDEWLTTGRNSCPLCRGQGVGESSNSQPTPLTS